MATPTVGSLIGPGVQGAEEAGVVPHLDLKNPSLDSFQTYHNYYSNVSIYLNLRERDAKLLLDVILFESGKLGDVSELLTTNSAAKLSPLDVMCAKVVEELEPSIRTRK